MDYQKLNGKKFDNGTIALKTKGNKTAVQLKKSGQTRTLGMIANSEVVKDFGQMNEVLSLLDKKAVPVTVQEGASGRTYRFVRLSRRPVAVIIFDYELSGTPEEMREKLEGDWKGTVRALSLDVELA
jgi:hypothetical protein